MVFDGVQPEVQVSTCGAPTYWAVHRLERCHLEDTNINLWIFLIQLIQIQILDSNSQFFKAKMFWKLAVVFIQ